MSVQPTRSSSSLLNDSNGDEPSWGAGNGCDTEPRRPYEQGNRPLRCRDNVESLRLGDLPEERQQQQQQQQPQRGVRSAVVRELFPLVLL
mmetsp:Transcript_76043/g.158576  ORF Transcript_76043/g.158576 Transcript_76043/m.158576 type:complete len:90 (+) Transcript_76043:518-787(+)